MSDALAAGAELLFREAQCLDEQRWDDWLALYAEDCEYWVPAWKGEHEPTADPKQEISLIYYSSRAGLEDRVWRIRSGRSIASQPLPRTQHMIGNVVLAGEAGGALRLRSNWTVHQFKTKRREVEVLFGRYEHELVRAHGVLRIRRKKILLLNDYMPGMLDFYSL
ncbi:MAG TPA: aromatic-ring-hydroxylating dioxygenase subunit beta [Burkholderiales bacterium]|nr:aromatic-ring-hydroxylating dioxygenase subunit beta [Burkholderiales bacterium]